MTQAAREYASGAVHAGRAGPSITEFLTPERVALDLHATSRKRLLEEVAALLMKGRAGLSRETVFQVLFERERLGSTAIGQGVALPHGRMNDLSEPIAAVARLHRPIDLDAPDQAPVDLVIALLVPADANETHLQLLAGLASTLSKPGVRARITAATDADELIGELGQCTCC
jgi:PTS system nitrogen regulatory IIA component